MRGKNGRGDAPARAPAPRFLAERKGLEQWRMRFLIGLRYHVDLLDASLFVDLAREAVLARPFVRRPLDAFLRRGIFVVLALEAERLVAPGELEKAEDLLERLAIDAIGFALVTGGR